MNIGIAGSGTIVPTFLQAQREIAKLNVKAICSTTKSEKKLKELADTYKIEKIYYEYDEMVKDTSLDCIYIAVPNHLHGRFGQMALRYGKHVICEKPFCSNFEEARQLAITAEKEKRFLFEAISNQYLPNYKKVRELLPSLGKIKIAEFNFSRYSSRYDDFKNGGLPAVFDVEKSGGALMDLNVYNVYFIIGLFGYPKKVKYFANLDRGIDTSGILIMAYPDFLCTSIAAKDSFAQSCIKIQGEEGYIYSDKPSNSFQDFRYVKRSGEIQDYRLHQIQNRLYYELLTFSHMVETNDWKQNRINMENTLAVQRILDEARKQVGIPFCFF